MYMAPEVLLCKEYNEKCDIWSAGVILYLLLSGIHPFYSPKKEEVMALVSKGAISFSSPSWDKVSQGAKDFVQKLLQYDPEKRPSAQEALSDMWIRERNSLKKMELEDVQISLNNLRAFRTQMTFQKAVLSYIASQQLSKEDEAKIRESFDILDADCDGVLSREELIKGFELMYGDVKKARKEVDSIMRRVDINQNGTIDYNGIIIMFTELEFLMANLEAEKALTKENLKDAFDYFDKVKTSS